MRSGKPDVYRPPGGRTERQVAADVIVRLLEGGVLSRTPSVIARAAAAVGIPIELVRRSWATRSAATPDRTLVASGDDLVVRAKPKPVYAPSYAGNIKTANERARAKKEPVPGRRKCNRCGELKDLDQLQIMNPRTLKRRPECKACNAIWRKERYLSVEKTKQLKTLVRFVVCEKDHLEADCLTCNQPIEAGQEVVADDVKLSHATCSAG